MIPKLLPLGRNTYPILISQYESSLFPRGDLCFWSYSSRFLCNWMYYICHRAFLARLQLSFSRLKTRWTAIANTREAAHSNELVSNCDLIYPINMYIWFQLYVQGILLWLHITSNCVDAGLHLMTPERQDTAVKRRGGCDRIVTIWYLPHEWYRYWLILSIKTLSLYWHVKWNIKRVNHTIRTDFRLWGN